MVKIKKILSDSDLSSIEQEISSIESVTSGEIVPVVARKSSAYKTVELIHAMIFIYLFMFIYYSVYSHLNLLGFVVISAVGAILSFALFRFGIFKRILIPKAVMKDKVHTAAMKAFYKYDVHNTKEKTGILIYVSVVERMVVVIGDEGIHSKVGNEAWNGVINTIILGIKRKELGRGIVDGIESCRDLLKTHFPAREVNDNELSNKVIYE